MCVLLQIFYCSLHIILGDLGTYFLYLSYNWSFLKLPHMDKKWKIKWIFLYLFWVTLAACFTCLTWFLSPVLFFFQNFIYPPTASKVQSSKMTLRCACMPPSSMEISNLRAYLICSLILDLKSRTLVTYLYCDDIEIYSYSIEFQRDNVCLTAQNKPQVYKTTQ